MIVMTYDLDTDVKAQKEQIGKNRFLDLPNNAENSGQNPGKGTWFRIGTGANLTLTMRACHVYLQKICVKIKKIVDKLTYLHIYYMI